jgi:hypothetical protein
MSMSGNGGMPLPSATIAGLAAARAMLSPLLFMHDRLARPDIGSVRTWSETGPCSFSQQASTHPSTHRGLQDEPLTRLAEFGEAADFMLLAGVSFDDTVSVHSPISRVGADV